MQKLEALVATLEKDRKNNVDIIAPATSLVWTPEDGVLMDNNGAKSIYKPTELFEAQVAEKLGIPSPYFKKLKLWNPTLLTSNINGWLNYYTDTNYLVRGVAKKASNVIKGRAFLSSSYNIIDNYEVLFAALEAIKMAGVKVEIKEAEVTESRMYLSVICPEVEVNAESVLRDYLKENDAQGNGIISGFTITNSEVGKGAFEIRPRAVICKCNNGLVVKDNSFRRVHIGSKLDAGEVQWSDHTRKKNRELIISQVSDAVKTYLSVDFLGVMIEKLADLNKIELQHPIDAVQNVCKTMSLEDSNKNEILQYFLRDGSPTAGGLYQAITREAQNMGADKRYEVEGMALEYLGKPKYYDKFSKN